MPTEVESPMCATERHEVRSRCPAVLLASFAPAAWWPARAAPAPPLAADRDPGCRCRGPARLGGVRDPVPGPCPATAAWRPVQARARVDRLLANRPRLPPGAAPAVLRGWPRTPSRPARCPPITSASTTAVTAPGTQPGLRRTACQHRENRTREDICPSVPKRITPDTPNRHNPLTTPPHGRSSRHFACVPDGHNGQIPQPSARSACQVDLSRQSHPAIGAAGAGVTGGAGLPGRWAGDRVRWAVTGCAGR